MNKTKDQQAQEYAEKEFPELLLTIKKEPWPKTREILAKAYSDGYTACEQSMTDSEATVIQGAVANLREILERLVADGDIEPIHVNVDEIINRVKEDI